MLHPRVATIVLAAGASRRFGTNKLLASLDGVPLVRHTVRNVLDASTGPVFVVIGRDADDLCIALDGLPVALIRNPDYEAGMSTSLLVGVRAALDSSAPGILIALADQPSVSPDTVRRLVEAFGRSTKPIVVPCYRSVRGHPVIFDTCLAAELLEVRGDRGARDVVARDPDRVEVVAFDVAPPPDVDVPEDLAAIAAHSTPSAGRGTEPDGSAELRVRS